MHCRQNSSTCAESTRTHKSFSSQKSGKHLALTKLDNVKIVQIGFCKFCFLSRFLSIEIAGDELLFRNQSIGLWPPLSFNQRCVAWASGFSRLPPPLFAVAPSLIVSSEKHCEKFSECANTMQVCHHET